MHCDASSPTIRNCTINNCVGGPADPSTGRGGAGGIQSLGGAPTIVGCIIDACTGGVGRAGGIEADGGTVTIDACTVSSNLSGGATAGIDASCGGITARGVDGMTLTGSVIRNNAGRPGYSSGFFIGVSPGNAGVGGLRMSTTGLAQSVMRGVVIRNNTGGAASPRGNLRQPRGCRGSRDLRLEHLVLRVADSRQLRW